MKIIFTATDKGIAQIGSRLIRAFEGGLASHCGVLLDNGQVVDTSWPKGVRSQSLDIFLHNRVVVATLDAKLPNENNAQKWLLSQLGNGYDILDIFSFLLWRDVGRRNKYVCSSLILRALLAGGVSLAERPDRFGVRHLLILVSNIGKYNEPD